MAFCNDCGAEIPVNNKFCTECGKPIGESVADGAVQPDPAPGTIYPDSEQPGAVYPGSTQAVTVQSVQAAENEPNLEAGLPFGPQTANTVPSAPRPAIQQPENTSVAGSMVPPQPQPGNAAQQTQQPVNTGFAGAGAQASSPARPVNTFPQPVNPVNPATHGVIGVGGYVGLMILFGIPVVGWIICIIMANVSKNLNRRNFARATLILIVIMIALSVVMYFIIGWIWEVFLEYAQGYTGEASGGLFSGFGNLFDLFGAMD